MNVIEARKTKDALGIDWMIVAFFFFFLNKATQSDACQLRRRK